MTLFFLTVLVLKLVMDTLAVVLTEFNVLNTWWECTFVGRSRGRVWNGVNCGKRVVGIRVEVEEWLL